MTTDIETIIFALFIGITPSLIWLWFWLKQDKEHPEPNIVLLTVFILGMVFVFLAIPIQKYIQNNISNEILRIISWATTEEILKFGAVIFLLYKTKYIDEPTDWPIYLITAALGFAALENVFFALKPLLVGENISGLLTGQLRFLGSTLLHSISSGIIGISLGLSFFSIKIIRKIYLIFGVILSIVLHSLFNFFIITKENSDLLSIFALLWVVTIFILLIFEKLRRMNNYNEKLLN